MQPLWAFKGKTHQNQENHARNHARLKVYVLMFSTRFTKKIWYQNTTLMGFETNIFGGGGIKHDLKVFRFLS